MNRTENLNQLETADYDLVIIGGGASGAGAALDATLRGMKVLLVEKEDFAAETSSKSTKLIHGGVRYLEQAFLKFQFGQLKQVRHGLEERHLLLRNAPHLARPLGLITPVFSWFAGMYYALGLKVYGLFASRKDTLPKAEWLSKKAALKRIGNLTPRAHSAVLYYDGQFDDARFCLGLAQGAAEAGATVLNHVALFDFEKNDAGSITAAVLQDVFSKKTYTIKSRAFLNCTGAGADIIRQKANSALKKRILPSKGVHLVLPLSALASEKDALLIPETPDGRVVFAIPFHGKLMLGTTDEAYKTPEIEPTLTDAEIDYLLETLAPYVDKVPKKSDVSAGFGGLRPLILAEDAASSKSLLRDHAIEIDAKSGLFSLLGGKWTTYRLMARDAVDAVAEKLKNTSECKTAEHFLPGGANFSESLGATLQTDYNLETDIAEHLLRNYGDRAEKVAAFCEEFPTDKNRLVEGFPYINAEVRYAARYEMACTPRDILARRLRLEILDWNACRKATRVVAGILAHELGHDEVWEQAAVETYQNQISSWKRLGK